jgi:hypothetical protein
LKTPSDFLQRTKFETPDTPSGHCVLWDSSEHYIQRFLPTQRNPRRYLQLITRKPEEETKSKVFDTSGGIEWSEMPRGNGNYGDFLITETAIPLLRI